MKQTYPAVNYRLPLMVFFFVMFGGVSAFMIWLIGVIDNTPLKVLFLVISLFFPFLIIYSISTKVILTKERLIKKSIIGSKSLSYNEIKSFGRYRQTGKSIYVNDSEKDSSTIRFIYVANRNDYHPTSFNQNGCIRFHYNKDLYKKIKEKINASR